MRDRPRLRLRRACSSRSCSGMPKPHRHRTAWVAAAQVAWRSFCGRSSLLAPFAASCRLRRVWPRRHRPAPRKTAGQRRWLRPSCASTSPSGTTRRRGPSGSAASRRPAWTCAGRSRCSAGSPSTPTRWSRPAADQSPEGSRSPSWPTCSRSGRAPTATAGRWHSSCRWPSGGKGSRSLAGRDPPRCRSLPSCRSPARGRRQGAVAGRAVSAGAWLPAVLRLRRETDPARLGCGLAPSTPTPAVRPERRHRGGGPSGELAALVTVLVGTDGRCAYLVPVSVH